MTAAVVRFARRALLVLAVALAAAVAIGIVIVALLRTAGSDTGLGPLIAVIAVTLLLLGLGGSSIWNGIGLARLRRTRPDAVVFLARREPTLAPDLPMYLHRKDLSVDVSDRWLIALIDDRGMAAWSGGPRPRELVLMEWSELGEITPAAFTSIEGAERFGVAVDVRPFPTPLLVRVGYSKFGLQAAFDHEGTVAVAETASARRPVRAGL